MLGGLEILSVFASVPFVPPVKRSVGGVAAQNLASNPPAYTSPQGLNRAPQQQQHMPAAPPPARPQGVGDPGPFATAPAAPPAPQGLARPAAPANTNGAGKIPYNPLMFTLTGS